MGDEKNEPRSNPRKTPKGREISGGFVWLVLEGFELFRMQCMR